MLGSGTSRQSDETKKDAVPVRNVYIPPLHVLVSTMGLGAERALAARAYIAYGDLLPVDSVTLYHTISAF